MINSCYFTDYGVPMVYVHRRVYVCYFRRASNMVFLYKLYFCQEAFLGATCQVWKWKPKAFSSPKYIVVRHEEVPSIRTNALYVNNLKCLYGPQSYPQGRYDWTWPCHSSPGTLKSTEDLLCIYCSQVTAGIGNGVEVVGFCSWEHIVDVLSWWF